MKFGDRKEFLYDGELFKRKDTTMALRFQAEFVRKHSSVPAALFCEVNRDPENVDPLWGVPKADRTKFDRTIKVPSIVTFEKAKIKLRRYGRSIEQLAKIWVTNLVLAELDYFPMAGDVVIWGGYRYEILELDFEPNSYWGQTNVWLGFNVIAAIMLEGDAHPVVDQSHVGEAEKAPKFIHDLPKSVLE